MLACIVCLRKVTLTPYSPPIQDAKYFNKRIPYIFAASLVSPVFGGLVFPNYSDGQVSKAPKANN